MNELTLTPGPFSSPMPTAALISGGGRTLRNLLEMQRNGLLPIEIRRVVASGNVKGIEHAQAFDIPFDIIRRKQYADDDAYREAVFTPCREAGAECVVMAGWLKHVLIPTDFENRVINIHPSLIPSFCGYGFYGNHVHEAVVKAGVRVTGCTVHFVDNQYDHGPIILQRPVDVLDEDTPETLAARVFEAESQALPEAIRRLANNQLRLVGRRVQTKNSAS